MKGYNADREQKHRFCDACHRQFWYLAEPGKDPPAICGAKFCMAWLDWPPETWSWRADQARLTVSMGMEPNDFDREALRRFPNPT